MSKPKKMRNPFYPLLVVVGAAFAISTFAYGIMALSAVKGAEGALENGTIHPLLEWLQQYGDRMLLVELALLAILTFLAISTDDYWERRSANSNV